VLCRCVGKDVLSKGKQPIRRHLRSALSAVRLDAPVTQKTEGVDEMTLKNSVCFVIFVWCSAMFASSLSAQELSGEGQQRVQDEVEASEAARIIEELELSMVLARDA
jgi:hypothetical protein